MQNFLYIGHPLEYWTKPLTCSKNPRIVTFSLHFTHHSKNRNPCLSLLFPKIKTYEWPEGKTSPVSTKNIWAIFFMMRFIVPRLKGTCQKKKTVYSSRKTTTICRVFMWAVVMMSQEPLALFCMFFKRFHREKMIEKKVIRDTVKDISVNIVLVSKTSL